MRTIPSGNEYLLSRISDALPGLAKEIITSSQNMDDERNKRFALHPDDAAEHETHWHQFGIITHSRRFLQALQTDVPGYLSSWGHEDAAMRVLNDHVGNASRWDLLQIAALLHDIGKFSARTEHGFKGHEVHSGRHVRTVARPLLRSLGLTNDQIEYIAICAEHHFELGKVRREAKRSGYTIHFVKSRIFKEKAEQIIRECHDIALEIGLMFLADSLAKTAHSIAAETDDTIAKQESKTRRLIASEGGGQNLVRATLQVPVNVAAAKSYLEVWRRLVER